jgi:hypothetical protein
MTNPDVPIVVRSYPITAAAAHYAAVVKPALVIVARAIGFKVGRYTGHGNPSTWLTPIDPASHLHGIMLYWHGTSVEAGIRTKAWKRDYDTPRGRLAHALTFGVHEAYGHSAKDAKTFRAMVTTAIQAAIAEEARKRDPR